MLTCPKAEIYRAHAQKYKPLLHCTESLKRDDIETYCSYMAGKCRKISKSHCDLELD